MSRAVPLLVLAALLGAGACSPAPEDIAARVAPRLPQALYAVLTMLDQDTTCGFSRADIVADGDVTGTVGQGGFRTDLIDACQVYLTSARPLLPGCEEDETAVMVEGRVLATGSRTQKGLVGEDKVITPTSPQHTSYDLSVQVFDLEVQDPQVDDVLTLVRGTIRFDAAPKFADSAAGCTVMGPHVYFDNIEYTRGGVRVANGSDIVESDVEFSALNAQLGTGPEGENFIQGSMVLFATEAEVGSEDAPLALSDDYVEQDEDDRLSCAADVAIPVGYTCGS